MLFGTRLLALVCYLCSHTEHGDGSTEGSYEYLIFFNVLLQIARECRLFPVLGYGAAQNLFLRVRICVWRHNKSSSMAKNIACGSCAQWPLRATCVPMLVATGGLLSACQALLPQVPPQPAVTRDCVAALRRLCLSKTRTNRYDVVPWWCQCHPPTQRLLPILRAATHE